MQVRQKSWSAYGHCKRKTGPEIYRASPGRWRGRNLLYFGSFLMSLLFIPNIARNNSMIPAVLKMNYIAAQDEGASFWQLHQQRLIAKRDTRRGDEESPGTV
jgi:hypothetical protein